MGPEFRVASEFKKDSFGGGRTLSVAKPKVSSEATSAYENKKAEEGLPSHITCYKSGSFGS